MLCKVIFILFLFFISSGFGRQVDCSSLGNTCRDCTKTEGCGWCQSAGKCMNATAENTPVGNCNIFWITCQDEDICLDNFDCFSCTSSSGCGWCDNRECLHGDSEGASQTSCQEWLFGNDSLCKTNCSRFSDCYSCTVGSDGSCGWCNSTSICTSGSADGPNSENCPGNGWMWNTCQSSGEQVDCTKHNNCSTCVNDVSDQCGWCESTKNCLQKDKECDDFKKDKICTDSCLDFSDNCTICTTNNNCGWCNTALCVEGSLHGPSFANCSNWNFNECPPNDTCLLYSDCSSCLQSPDSSCGWCENGASSGCMDKTDGTQCQGQWKTMQCTAYVFTCNSLTNCDDCVNYPPGECVWCSGQNACRLAIEVGTSCEYSCGGSGFNMNPGVISALVIVGVAVVGLAFGLWYRFYWVKRHYYERLR